MLEVGPPVRAPPARIRPAGAPQPTTH
jgi:hypothetical protein